LVVQPRVGSNPVAELLAPISKRLVDEIAASELVHADETPLKVQARVTIRTSYLWTSSIAREKLRASRFADVDVACVGQ
jgi:hypothetical protein